MTHPLTRILKTQRFFPPAGAKKEKSAERRRRTRRAEAERRRPCALRRRAQRAHYKYPAGREEKRREEKKRDAFQIRSTGAQARTDSKCAGPPGAGARPPARRGAEHWGDAGVGEAVANPDKTPPN